MVERIQTKLKKNADFLNREMNNIQGLRVQNEALVSKKNIQFRLENNIYRSIRPQNMVFRQYFSNYVKLFQAGNDPNKIKRFRTKEGALEDQKLLVRRQFVRFYEAKNDGVRQYFFEISQTFYL